MDRIYRPRIKEESFIYAIGEISIRYALLEELVTACINILIGGEDASILTAGIPFSRSLTIFSALYRQKYNIELKEDKKLKRLLKKAEEAGEERNKIIHSIWERTYMNDLFIRTKRRINRSKGLNIDTQMFDILELERVIDIINDSVNGFEEFAYELLAERIVQITYPLDNAVLGERPEFFWRSVKGAIGYEIMIAKDPDFNNIAVSKIGSNYITDMKYDCEIALQKNVLYYWRVRPIIATEKGYWTATRSFTVE